MDFTSKVAHEGAALTVGLTNACAKASPAQSDTFSEEVFCPSKLNIQLKRTLREKVPFVCQHHYRSTKPAGAKGRMHLHVHTHARTHTLVLQGTECTEVWD